MARSNHTSTLELPKGYIDVLYLKAKGQMPRVIKQLLKEKKLSFSVFPIDKFSQILNRLELIGTVIIDAKDLGSSEHQKLAKIIESLEIKDIGTIVINRHLETPVKSFSLGGSQVKSFSLANNTGSFSIDELWLSISVNLAYRRNGSGILVKPAAPPSSVQRTYNNRLSEQLRMAGALVDNLGEQLRMAGLVQRDFLPKELPETEGIQWAATFLPAEWVSGDIYDIARIDEQHIAFYVADVLGHGLPAALLTMFLKQALIMQKSVERSPSENDLEDVDTKEYSILPPSEVMTRLNVRMAEQKLSGYQFATSCYCLLNVETYQLTYARAGHPYPILIRQQQQPEQLEIQGSLLGIFEQAEYFEQTVQLHPGDRLLVYSDGAEPFIGHFDDLTGFRFSKEFNEIKDLPIVELMDRFNVLAQSLKNGDTEVDDITAVGFEIL
jgi:sigma-B regulation protein RsbU (phosphoserine phosphatase)